MNNKLPIAKTKDIVVQESGEELLIYHLDNHKAACLNKTAKLVWEMCNGRTSISEIARAVEKQTGTKHSEQIVELTLSELQKSNLLAEDGRSKFDFLISNFSRRDLIIKYGVPMTSLPIITSLIAPQAIQAQSPTCIGQFCDTNTPCCPGASCDLILNQCI